MKVEQDRREYNRNYAKLTKLRRSERKKAAYLDPDVRRKALARHATRAAIKSGEIRPEPCFVCGDRAHAHHWDYSDKFAITWLCKTHHAELHQEHIANNPNTHCKHGHAFTPDNTDIFGGNRHCKTCVRNRMREYRSKTRAPKSNT